MFDSVNIGRQPSGIVTQHFFVGEFSDLRHACCMNIQ